MVTSLVNTSGASSSSLTKETDSWFMVVWLMLEHRTTLCDRPLKYQNVALVIIGLLPACYKSTVPLRFKVEKGKMTNLCCRGCLAGRLGGKSRMKIISRIYSMLVPKWIDVFLHFAGYELFGEEKKTCKDGVWKGDSPHCAVNVARLVNYTYILLQGGLVVLFSIIYVPCCKKRLP